MNQSFDSVAAPAVAPRIRILDAAERVFADTGFAAASLRRIIAAAGVNLAAVHYYFGSKEGLITAVFDRRIGPLNAERLALLDQLEAEGHPQGIKIEDLVEVLVGPALRLARDPAKGGPVVMRLFGRILAEPSEFLGRLLREQFQGVVTRFAEAFGRALPHLPRAVLLWRLEFAVGSMGHVMCDLVQIRERSEGLCDAADTETVIRELVSFLAAAFRAPVRDGGGAC
jgi:AcrR family transcriptional regulator